MGTEHVRSRVPVAAEAERDPAVTSPHPAFRPVPVGGLTVGHAEDPAERAADAAADVALARLRRAIHASAAAPQPHRHEVGCGHLRRSQFPSPAVAPQVGAAGGDLDEETSARIRRQVGQGAPLPGAVRERMETAFGTSLAHVRVHDGPEAARLNGAVSAAAFTTGHDIFFGAGRFDPTGDSGDRILAHEIAHVLQDERPLRRLAVNGHHEFDVRSPGSGRPGHRVQG